MPASPKPQPGDLNPLWVPADLPGGSGAATRRRELAGARFPLSGRQPHHLRPCEGGGPPIQAKKSQVPIMLAGDCLLCSAKCCPCRPSQKARNPGIKHSFFGLSSHVTRSHGFMEIATFSVSREYSSNRFIEASSESCFQQKNTRLLNVLRWVKGAYCWDIHDCDSQTPN